MATAPSFSHVCTRDERDALQAMIPVYAEGLAPASRKGCRRAIGKVALAFPSAKLNDDEAEARLELYADALADIPADVLADACMTIVRTSKFFPAVSEIRAKCSGLAKRQWELSKIRALIATHDRDWRPEGEPLTSVERAELARMTAKAA